MTEAFDTAPMFTHADQKVNVVAQKTALEL
jgi:hypothetical protein